jgi:DNA repair protein RecO (recombination protein O)
VTARGDRFEGLAIVVGYHDYGEADRIVRLVSPDFGLVAAIAKGVRGSRRRYAGAIDIGNRVRVEVRPTRGELWRMYGAEVEDGRLGIRGDLVNLALMGTFCEITGALCRPSDPAPRRYGLLDTALLLLDAMTGPPASAFRPAFEAKALTFAGLAPCLARCARCDGALEEPIRFSAEAGGAVHLECAPGVAVSAVLLAALEKGRRTPMADLVDVDLPEGRCQLLLDFLEYQLGRGLRTRSWLTSLEAG